MATVAWLAKNWSKVLIVVLVVAVVVQTKAKNRLQTKLNKAENSLELKEGELAKVRIGSSGVATGGKVDAPGGIPDFVPPEADVDVTMEENAELRARLNKVLQELAALQNQPDDAEKRKALEEERAAILAGMYGLRLDFKSRGFTFRPGYGVLYSGKFLAEVDAKFFYWGRYSLKTGLTTEFISGGISRHIDDLVPFITVRNTEVQAVLGADYNGGLRTAIGARTNW